MPGPPSPPVLEDDEAVSQRPSLRWDAAQRAARDNDLATLQLLITQGHLFENVSALQESCRDGTWGRGTTSTSNQTFTTQDSVRLSTLLQTVTTRGHVQLIQYLLETFPAKDLHVLEWEVIVNALASGRVDVLEPFLEVDPGLVEMQDVRFGTCFTVLFDLVAEKEKHLPMVRLLCEHGANVANLPGVLEDVKRTSTPEVMQYLEQLILLSQISPNKANG